MECVVNFIFQIDNVNTSEWLVVFFYLSIISVIQQKINNFYRGKWWLALSFFSLLNGMHDWLPSIWQLFDRKWQNKKKVIINQRHKISVYRIPTKTTNTEKNRSSKFCTVYTQTFNAINWLACRARAPGANCQIAMNLYI